MDSPGSLLAVLGALVVLGSFLWLHARGFKDSAFPDPILLLTGVSLIAYVVTRWDRAKVPTLLALGGLVLALVAAPVSNLFSQQQRAIGAYNQGVEAIDREDFDLAIACFTEAIRLDPQFADAYYNRGFAHFETGNLDQAIADLSEVIRLDPEDGKAFYNRGVAYKKGGDGAKAEADFARAGALGCEPE